MFLPIGSYYKAMPEPSDDMKQQATYIPIPHATTVTATGSGTVLWPAWSPLATTSAKTGSCKSNPYAARLQTPPVKRVAKNENT